MNFRNIQLGSRPLTIGIIFGVILSFVLILYGFIAPVLQQTLGTISLFVNIAIYVILGFLAGRRASRLTGQLISGVAAGALAGLISALLTGIYELVVTYLNIDYYVQQAQIVANKQHPVIHITPAYYMQAELEYLITPLLFSFLLVLIGGTMGGLLGRNRARLAPVAEEQGQEQVITSTATPVQDEEDDAPSPSYSSNGNGNGAATRRSAASRRSRNARRNRSMN